MNYLLIPTLFGLWAAYVTFVLIQKEDSFLTKRIKNAGKKFKTSPRKFFDNLLEVLRPLTAGNIKNINVKNKIKALLVRVGAPSSEDDILDFENRRLMVVLFVSLFCAVLLTVYKLNQVVLCISCVAIYFAYKYPELKIKRLINIREKDFLKNFPDAIDMLSVSRINHPRERLYEGEDIKVVLRKREPEKLTFSLKELLGTWRENAALFEPGETVTGTVRSIEPYGVFVELMPNLAGLAEPCDYLFEGQQVAVYIKSVLPDKMKIKLVIVEAFDESKMAEELTYFVHSEHIDRFDYSTPNAPKEISTVFDEEIQKIS